MTDKKIVKTMNLEDAVQELYDRVDISIDRIIRLEKTCLTYSLILQAVTGYVGHENPEIGEELATWIASFRESEPDWDVDDELLAVYHKRLVQKVDAFN